MFAWAYKSTFFPQSAIMLKTFSPLNLNLENVFLKNSEAPSFVEVDKAWPADDTQKAIVYFTKF